MDDALEVDAKKVTLIETRCMDEHSDELFASTQGAKRIPTRDEQAGRPDWTPSLDPRNAETFPVRG